MLRGGIISQVINVNKNRSTVDIWIIKLSRSELKDTKEYNKVELIKTYSKEY